MVLSTLMKNHLRLESGTERNWNVDGREARRSSCRSDPPRGVNSSGLSAAPDAHKGTSASPSPPPPSLLLQPFSSFTFVRAGAAERVDRKGGGVCGPLTASPPIDLSGTSDRRTRQE